MEKLLELRNIGLCHNKKWLLHNINASFYRGEIVTIIGHNGAGKSTIAKLALGIVKADSGQIWQPPGIKFSYVPQRLSLDRALPLTALRLMTLNKKINAEVVKHYLNEVGIYDLRHAQISNLSGGELQKLLLARAAAQQADMLVLDEPLQGVDYGSEERLYEFIASLPQKLNCCVLLISHDLKIVMSATDRVLCIDQTICCSGRAEEVVNSNHYIKLLNGKHIHNHSLHEHNIKN
ncbi:MAG: metal ABC transporter ATP-binding protein [Alphaproteobacteria bacterium]|nr:metal ABC transporter ATP-binding protein [Alphaproteobacteria bacterium]